MLARIVLAATLVTAWSAVCSATSFPVIPLPKLIATSDVVAVGHLTQVRLVGTRRFRADWGPETVHEYEGTIRVERTLWPEMPKSQVLLFAWEEWEAFGNTPPYRQWLGQRVLWLLKRTKKGTFGSDYPRRTIPLDDRRTLDIVIRQFGPHDDDTPSVRAVHEFLTSEIRVGRP